MSRGLERMKLEKLFAQDLAQSKILRDTSCCSYFASVHFYFFLLTLIQGKDEPSQLAMRCVCGGGGVCERSRQFYFEFLSNIGEKSH